MKIYGRLTFLNCVDIEVLEKQHHSFLVSPNGTIKGLLFLTEQGFSQFLTFAVDFCLSFCQDRSAQLLVANSARVANVVISLRGKVGVVISPQTHSIHVFKHQSGLEETQASFAQVQTAGLTFPAPCFLSAM